MTGAEALRLAIPRLRAAGVEDPAGDARRLLAFALGLDPGRLTLHLPDPMGDAMPAFEAAIAARAARRPVAQITGLRDFYGLSFRVTPDVLDPRPDTEALVTEALAEPFASLLDLGTGSGCILLSCLANQPDAMGTGIDISPAALAVAQDNAARLGLAGRATFRIGDWFQGIQDRFDLITANPPYIAEAEMEGLAPELLLFEPRIALTPGGDGLDPYRHIASGAPGRLNPGGRLLVEIGWQQGRAVAQLFGAAGLRDIRVLPDLEGRDRVVAARAGA